MAKLSWGEPTVKATKEGGESAITFPEIRQGTATLETEDGELTEALDEGGDVVDSRKAKSRYTFSCDVYMQKGMTPPINPDDDGKILDNYSLEVIPEDETTVGFKFALSRVSLTVTWTSEVGMLLHYEFAAIKPKGGSGKTFELTNVNLIYPLPISGRKQQQRETLSDSL